MAIEDFLNCEAIYRAEQNFENRLSEDDKISNKESVELMPLPSYRN
jgi:hypothetical protein